MSSVKLMGHTMNSKTHFRALTQGANLAAMESWFGPVNMADGMISPNTSTKETEKEKPKEKEKEKEKEKMEERKKQDENNMIIQGVLYNMTGVDILGKSCFEIEIGDWQPDGAARPEAWTFKDYVRKDFTLRQPFAPNFCWD